MSGKIIKSLSPKKSGWIFVQSLALICHLGWGPCFIPFWVHLFARKSMQKSTWWSWSNRCRCSSCQLDQLTKTLRGRSEIPGKGAKVWATKVYRNPLVNQGTWKIWIKFWPGWVTILMKGRLILTTSIPDSIPGPCLSTNAPNHPTRNPNMQIRSENLPILVGHETVPSTQGELYGQPQVFSAHTSLSSLQIYLFQKSSSRNWEAPPFQWWNEHILKTYCKP